MSVVLRCKQPEQEQQPAQGQQAELARRAQEGEAVTMASMHLQGKAQLAEPTGTSS
jgi:hypothetical protein